MTVSESVAHCTAVLLADPAPPLPPLIPSTRYVLDCVLPVMAPCATKTLSFICAQEFATVLIVVEHNVAGPFLTEPSLRYRPS